ncbi:hypothetical protein ACWGLG_16340 [Streptomyces antimycoticus]
MNTRPEPTDRAEVQKLAEAVEEVLIEEMRASRRSDNPDLPSWEDGPRIGTTPPVPQPGIPPMSVRTTETVRAVMFASLATVPPGLIAIGILVASQHADPTVIGMICAAPAAIAVPILALARLMRRVKDTLPTEQHHHYNGPVYQDQRNIHSKTSGVWAKTNNQLAE